MSKVVIEFVLLNETLLFFVFLCFVLCFFSPVSFFPSPLLCTVKEYRDTFRGRAKERWYVRSATSGDIFKALRDKGGERRTACKVAAKQRPRVKGIREV